MLRIKSLGNGRFLLLLLFLILSLTIVEVQADAALINQKLSGSTPLADKSKIPEFRISPDGQTVVFMAHIEPTSTYELYSVPMNGSAEPTRLTTGLLPEGADIGHGFLIVVVWFIGRSKIRVMFMNCIAFLSQGADYQAEHSLATTTVAYAISGGTAVNGEDYNLTAGTVTFLPGEIEQQIEIKIVEDVLAEGDETAVITLSDPQNGILGAQSSLTLTIAGEQETFSVYLPMITK